MSDSKMREEFEAWVIEVKSAELVAKCGGGMKRSSCETIVKATWFASGGMAPMACELFEAWKASRSALVIELPDRFSEAYQDYFDDVEGGCFNESKYITDLHKNIEATGVKVKS